MKLYKIFNNTHTMTGLEAYAEMNEALWDGLNHLNFVFSQTFRKFDWELAKTLRAKYLINPDAKLMQIRRNGKAYSVINFFRNEFRLQPDDLLCFRGENWEVPARLLVQDPMACAVDARLKVRELQLQQRNDFLREAINLQRIATNKQETLRREIEKLQKESSGEFIDSYRKTTQRKESWVKQKQEHKLNKKVVEAVNAS